MVTLGRGGTGRRRLRSLIEGEGLGADLDVATWCCWSTMQGLVTLGPKLDVISGQHGQGEISSRNLVRDFTGLIVAGLRNPSSRV